MTKYIVFRYFVYRWHVALAVFINAQSEVVMDKRNIIIFGDSYSTFAGCIPQGYAPYYTGTGERVPDIASADESWWGLLMNETGWKLVRNDSWSGAPICYRGYNGTDVSKSCSFIYRLKKLREEGYFAENEIDTVLVLGGTNDSWCGAEIGEEKREGWESEDLYSVLPAVWYYFTDLRSTFPKAQIYTICNCDINEKIIDAMVRASESVGAVPVLLHDIDKLEGHPTKQGMMEIKEQVLATMLK